MNDFIIRRTAGFDKWKEKHLEGITTENLSQFKKFMHNFEEKWKRKEELKLLKELKEKYKI